GELDMLAYEKADVALSPLFEAPGDVTLDVSDLTFIDSSGIRLFVRLERAIRERGTLHLRGPSPHIARVFEVAGPPDLGIVVEDDGVYLMTLPVIEGDPGSHRGMYLMAAMVDDFSLHRGTDANAGTTVRLLKCAP